MGDEIKTNMSREDRISIVIPVYNGEKYLRENVESVLAQTYKNLEVIYVCDGCTDHTVDILQNYSLYDSRLMIHIVRKNLGAANARNTGMARATGEWIIFLDSDDLFAAEMIETMHEQAVREGADVCCCFWEKFDEKPVYDGYIGNKLFKQYCKTYPVIHVADEKKNLLQLVLLSPCNKLINRKVYEKDSIYFQMLPNCDDAYFSFVSFVEATKIVYVDRILFYYRSNIGRKTLSTDQKEKKNYIYEAYDGFFQYLSLKEDPDLQQSFYNRVCRDIYILFGTKLYQQLFHDLRSIYFPKWKMQRTNVFKKLSYFNREIYKRICANNLDLDRESLMLQAEVNFVRETGMTGVCSLWGCGYKGEKLLEILASQNIEVAHIYDSDSNKWGTLLYGNTVEAFKECREDNIFVTTSQYYEEIKRQIGSRVVNVFNLEKEIFLIQ